MYYNFVVFFIFVVNYDIKELLLQSLNLFFYCIINIFNNFARSLYRVYARHWFHINTHSFRTMLSLLSGRNIESVYSYVCLWASSSSSSSSRRIQHKRVLRDLRDISSNTCRICDCVCVCVCERDLFTDRRADLAFGPNAYTWYDCTSSNLIFSIQRQDTKCHLELLKQMCHFVW